MKRLRKILGCILVVTIVVSICAACTQTETVNKKNGKLTYWVTMDGSMQQTLNSFNEHLVYKEMMKRLNLDVEFVHPSAGSTGGEAFQVLLASNSFPDMIEHFWNQYPGGGEQAIQDGIIISLNKYMKKYAPNYYDLMEGDTAKKSGYKYKSDAITKEGNYYGFKCINIGKYRNYGGLYVRKDLLDKWGLDIPTTLDEWEVLFETAKKNGIKYPLTGAASTLDFFVEPYKIQNKFYLEGNTVKYGPFQSEFKDYLKKMADWMKKGYIDIDYITNDQVTIHGAICNGTSIAASGAVGGDLGKIIPAMKDRNPDFELAACPAISMKKGEKPYFQAIEASATDRSVAISVQCGEEDEQRYFDALKWCDYLYSEEGLVLKNFGIENDTFKIEKDESGNNRYVYTDKITDWKNSDIGATNIEAAIFHYVVPANHPGYNQHMDYFNGYYSYDEQKDAIETWNMYLDEAYKHVLPQALQYTADEASESAVIEAAGKNDFDAVVSNIILGKASVDTYDDAVKALRKAGYDRLVEIKQAAYDRYISYMQ